MEELLGGTGSRPGTWAVTGAVLQAWGRNDTAHTHTHPQECIYTAATLDKF